MDEWRESYKNFVINFTKKTKQNKFYFHQDFNLQFNKLPRAPITDESITPL